jgi:hypothetical protein
VDSILKTGERRERPYIKICDGEFLRHLARLLMEGNLSSCDRLETSE